MMWASWGQDRPAPSSGPAAMPGASLAHPSRLQPLGGALSNNKHNPLHQYQVLGGTAALSREPQWSPNGALRDDGLGPPRDADMIRRFREEGGCSMPRTSVIQQSSASSTYVPWYPENLLSQLQATLAAVADLEARYDIEREQLTGRSESEAVRTQVAADLEA